MEGNNNAMRDALKQALYFLRRHHTGAVYATDGETLIFCDDVANIVDNALSKPPRNCDIAQDWLRDLYVNFKPPASVKREMPPEWVDAVMAFCRWLVAPAAEKEGGAK